MGTLNAGYYLDRSKQNQIRLWGSKGWMHLELTSGEPLKWYSTHPDAPRGVQLFDYQDTPSDRYRALVHAAVDFTRGQAPPPMTAEECLHLMRVIFAGYPVRRDRPNPGSGLTSGGFQPPTRGAGGTAVPTLHIPATERLAGVPIHRGSGKSPFAAGREFISVRKGRMLWDRLRPR